MPAWQCTWTYLLAGSLQLGLLLPSADALAASVSSDGALRRRESDSGLSHPTRGLFMTAGLKTGSVSSQTTHRASTAGQVMRLNHSKMATSPKTVYYEHGPDGLMLDSYFSLGTSGCTGVSWCQHLTLPAAKAFCESQGECRGILQKVPGDDAACDGGFGCYFPAQGTLAYQASLPATSGKFWERQVTQYASYEDGRSFSAGFTNGTRGCPGVWKCQFRTLSDAVAFCDPEPKCLGVHHYSEAVNGTNCNGDYGCFSPMTGNLDRDPLWLSRGGVTYEKMQQVAYRLGDEGSVYDERFDVGTEGCVGEHHCQFTTLGAAESFCDVMPTCKGVMQHPTNGKKYCGGGLGCFTPAKGSYVFDQLWFVLEGKTYLKQFVR